MNSYISLALAADRAKDMQCDAAVARFYRETRRARRMRRNLEIVDMCFPVIAHGALRVSVVGAIRHGRLL